MLSPEKLLPRHPDENSHSLTPTELYAIEVFNKAISRFVASPKDKVGFVNIFIDEIRNRRE